MINPIGKEQNKSNREEKLKEIKEEIKEEIEEKLKRFKNGKLSEKEIKKLRETIAANLNILDADLIEKILGSGIFELKESGFDPYKKIKEGLRVLLEALKKKSQKSPEESNDAQS
jgi:uncharacterized protein YpuA (DUF1002 family)